MQAAEAERACTPRPLCWFRAASETRLQRRREAQQQRRARLQRQRTLHTKHAQLALAPSLMEAASEPSAPAQVQVNQSTATAQQPRTGVLLTPRLMDAASEPSPSPPSPSSCCRLQRVGWTERQGSLSAVASASTTGEGSVRWDARQRHMHVPADTAPCVSRLSPAGIHVRITPSCAAKGRASRWNEGGQGGCSRTKQNAARSEAG